MYIIYMFIDCLLSAELIFFYKTDVLFMCWIYVLYSKSYYYCYFIVQNQSLLCLVLL
jgi:hypothetical protein